MTSNYVYKCVKKIYKYKYKYALFTNRVMEILFESLEKHTLREKKDKNSKPNLQIVHTIVRARTMYYDKR